MLSRAGKVEAREPGSKAPQRRSGFVAWAVTCRAAILGGVRDSRRSRRIGGYFPAVRTLSAPSARKEASE